VEGPPAPPPTAASPGESEPVPPAEGAGGTAPTTRIAALVLAAVLLVGAFAVVALTRGRTAGNAAGTATTLATAAPVPAPAPVAGEPAGLPRSNPAQYCTALLTFKVVGDYDTVASRFMTDSTPFVAAIETAAVTAPEDVRVTTASLVPLVHDLADKVAVRAIGTSAELQAVQLSTGAPAWGHIYEVIIPAVIRHCAGRT
jgi:hypothetical protein